MASVILDAGHGGYDGGASYQGRLEKDDNLRLALAIGNILANNGVDVLYSRTDDIYQSPNEKAGIANRSGADYLISIHRNSSPAPNVNSGIETLVFQNQGIPALFAENIDRELEQLGFINRGTKERPGLAVLRGTRMPAALVEVGFLNNEKDNQMFDEQFDAIANAIAQGILQSIQSVEGIQTSETMEEPAQSTDAVNTDVRSTGVPDTVPEKAARYHIELGMFRHKSNAENLAENLQKDGYDCYIVPRNDYYSVCHGDYSSMQEAEADEQALFRAGYETRLILAEDY